MSRRAIKQINWAALAERIPESDRNILAAFKAKSDQYLRRMMASPESAPKIDWAYYRKNVASASLVEKFQKQYESMSIPYPADKYTSTIEAQEKEALAKMEDFVRQADQAVGEYQKEINRINNLLPVDQMTMEDFKDLHSDESFSPEKPSIWPHDEDAQPIEEQKNS